MSSKVRCAPTHLYKKQPFSSWYPSGSRTADQIPIAVGHDDLNGRLLLSGEPEVFIAQGLLMLTGVSTRMSEST